MSVLYCFSLFTLNLPDFQHRIKAFIEICKSPKRPYKNNEKFAKQTLPGYCFYLNAQVRAWLKPVFPGIVK